MSEFAFDTLIANATPLPPGGQVQGSIIDVTGAREVNVMMSITNTDAAVRWAIHFGPTTNNAFALCRQGTFGSLNTQAISIPVFGTDMFVVVTNQGQNNWHVSGKVYFIRDVT
jgi:hypothetical protein